MNEKPVIEYDSDEAAKPMTIDGWVSKSGFFFKEENHARYDGCTHKRCGCGNLTEKWYTKCKTCRDKAETVKFYARPAKDWDGKAMIFSDSHDVFFSTPDEAEEYAEDNDTDMEGLRLVICDPVYARQIDGDFFCDDLPEDGDLPVEIETAIESFNKAVAGIILSWKSGEYRLLIENQKEKK